jgi:hypothetical protein
MVRPVFLLHSIIRSVYVVTFDYPNSIRVVLEVTMFTPQEVTNPHTSVCGRPSSQCSRRKGQNLEVVFENA